MRSGNRLPEMKRDILAALAQSSVVRVECDRPQRLARVLRKELQMCEIKVERETPSDTRGMMRTPPRGVIAVSWRAVE